MAALRLLRLLRLLLLLLLLGAGSVGGVELDARLDGVVRVPAPRDLCTAGAACTVNVLPQQQLDARDSGLVLATWLRVNSTVRGGKSVVQQQRATIKC